MKTTTPPYQSLEELLKQLRETINEDKDLNCKDAIKCIDQQLLLLAAEYVGKQNYVDLVNANDLKMETINKYKSSAQIIKRDIQNLFNAIKTRPVHNNEFFIEAFVEKATLWMLSLNDISSHDIELLARDVNTRLDAYTQNIERSLVKSRVHIHTLNSRLNLILTVVKQNFPKTNNAARTIVDIVEGVRDIKDS